MTTKDVLPAEDPQGAQPGLSLARGAIAHMCDFSGAGPQQAPAAPGVTLEWHPAPVAAGNTPCNCSLLRFLISKHFPFKNALFFKLAEETVRIWGR